MMSKRGRVIWGELFGGRDFLYFLFCTRHNILLDIFCFGHVFLVCVVDMDMVIYFMRIFCFCVSLIYVMYELISFIYSMT